jgi:hypothetical protein
VISETYDDGGKRRQMVLRTCRGGIGAMATGSRRPLLRLNVPRSTGPVKRRERKEEGQRDE